jgi:signal transduction histidine kinase
MLNLSIARGDPAKDDSETIALLAEIHHQLSDLLHAMPGRTTPEVSRLGLLGALRQILQEEMDNLFDEVVWQVQPEVEIVSSRIPPIASEVLFFAAREVIRNAAQHGRGKNGDPPLHLCIRVEYQDNFVITIEDNGVGFTMSESMGPAKGTVQRESGETESLDRDRNFPGRGSGQGLALHSTMMAVIGGTLTIDSMPEEYTRVSLVLPKLALQS